MHDAAHQGFICYIGGGRSLITSPRKMPEVDGIPTWNPDHPLQPQRNGCAMFEWLSTLDEGTDRSAWADFDPATPMLRDLMAGSS